MSSDLRVRVIEGAELQPEHFARWAEIQTSQPLFDGPYFRPEFTCAAATTRPDVRVGIMESGGRIVGFFPFEHGRFGIGTPVGGILSDYQAAIVEPEAEWEARDLIAQCGLRIWDFHHLLREQKPFAPHHREASASPAIEVPRNFEEWPHGPGRTVRSWIRQGRRLTKQQEDVRFTFDARDDDAFDRVITWKREQCRRTGVFDFFGDPAYLALVRRIYETRTPDFGGLLSVLYVRDRVAAAHFGMVSRDVLHWWFPVYDHELARYSPGMVLLVQLLRVAREHGIRLVDLGKGDEFYKRKVQTCAIPLAVGSVEVTAWLGSARRARDRSVALLRRSPLRPGLRALRRLGRRW